jgi:plastocyanin
MDTRRCILAATSVAAFSGSALAETIRVEMGSLAYKPATISAHVGDTIEWTNTDFLAHTATARDKEWDVMLLPKKTGQIIVKKSGDIEYYCRFHPNMVGYISVAE